MTIYSAQQDGRAKGAEPMLLSWGSMLSCWPGVFRKCWIVFEQSVSNYFISLNEINSKSLHLQLQNLVQMTSNGEAFHTAPQIGGLSWCVFLLYFSTDRNSPVFLLMMLAVADAMFFFSKTLLFTFIVYEKYYYRTFGYGWLPDGLLRMVIFSYCLYHVALTAGLWTIVVGLGERYVQHYQHTNCIRYNSYFLQFVKIYMILYYSDFNARANI